jgi:hypothetical protein
MTREVDIRVEHNSEHVRHGSAVVALCRLTHRERDGRVVVEDDPVSELIKSLSEIVAFIERRTTEPNKRNDGAAPKRTESVAPAALVPFTLQDDDTGTVTISLRFDTDMLARVDAAARKRGISRTAWLHIAASERVEGRR